MGGARSLRGRGREEPEALWGPGESQRENPGALPVGPGSSRKGQERAENKAWNKGGIGTAGQGKEIKARTG